MINLKQFGKDFIKQSRDESIDIYQKIVSGEMKSEKTKKLYDLLNRFNEEDMKVINILIKDALDRIVFLFVIIFQESKDFTTLNEEADKHF